VAVDVDTSGYVYVVNDAGEVWKKTSSWTDISFSGKARDVAAYSSSNVWHVEKDNIGSTTDGYINKLNSGANGWDKQSGAANRITVGASGAWVADKSFVYSGESGSLVKVAGTSANDIGIGIEGSVYVITKTERGVFLGNTIQRLFGTTWKNFDAPYPPANPIRIAVGAAGEPWVVNESG
jgi:hypothetical protein